MIDTAVVVCFSTAADMVKHFATIWYILQQKLSGTLSMNSHRNPLITASHFTIRENIECLIQK